ncbi:MAG: glycosyltransferase [Bdellovibrionota bacterium]
MDTIAVIIPVRNRPEMLERAVRSVLGQRYEGYSLLVVDDGSDADMSRVRELVEANGHSWIRQEHQGVSAARNAGIQSTDAEWYAFLDSDDAWMPDKLAAHREFHSAQKQVWLSQSLEIWHRNGIRVNQKKIHAMPEGDGFAASLKRCCISPSSVFMHHALFEKYGLFDEELPVCEDYDLWLRITACELIGLVKHPLVLKYGGHPDQLSRSRSAMDRYRVYALLKLLSSSSLLEGPRREAAVLEALKKVQILILGARKHAPVGISVYEQLLEKIKSGDVQGAYEQMRELLIRGKGVSD